MNEQTKADIRKSIAILKEKGWTHGRYFDVNTGEFCMVGALRQVIFGSPYLEFVNRPGHQERLNRFHNAYSVVYDVTRTKPEKFNDRCKRRRQVIRALKEAEAKA